MPQEMLEICGLACLASAAFTIALPLGFATCGVFMLFIAWRRSR